MSGVGVDIVSAEIRRLKGAAAHDFDARAKNGTSAAFNGGIWFGNKITIDAAGHINSVVADGGLTPVTGVNFVPAIYTDAAGAPGTLLGSGPQVNNGVAGDNVLALTTPLLVTLGEIIWVGAFYATVPTYTTVAATAGTDLSVYYIASPPAAPTAPACTTWSQRLRIFARGTVP